MNILGTICARGGSKGVPNKNIRNLGDKPLIYYTISVLKKWGKASKIIVSTDSKKIARIANEYGVETPFLRPPELATDTAPKIPVIQHALKFCETQYNTEYDVVVDLDPTAPIRTVNDLDNALDKFVETKAQVLYSVTVAKKSPYFNMVELDENGNACLSKSLGTELFRRQDAPVVYAINGSIYIYDRDHLINAKGLHCEREKIYIMDEIASVDIDREIDFKFLEFLLESGLVHFD
jgi:N-acylneuraminate cytidylyltransferase/CMP-N,N'-diacetyllegionaminic acid synthase